MRMRDGAGKRVRGIRRFDLRGWQQAAHHRKHLRLFGMAHADDRKFAVARARITYHLGW